MSRLITGSAASDHKFYFQFIGWLACLFHMTMVERQINHVIAINAIKFFSRLPR